MSEPVGPIVDDACDRYGDCKRPRAEHRESFMDLRDGVIDHDFVAPAPRPYDHERVPAMITTEWRCHACGAEHDVWGTGATEGYMECGRCGSWSWLDFNPDGYEAQTESLATPSHQRRQPARGSRGQEQIRLRRYPQRAGRKGTMNNDERPTCRDCDKPAIAVDTEYGEGYCETHFREQQASSEPVTHFRSVP